MGREDLRAHSTTGLRTSVPPLVFETSAFVIGLTTGLLLPRVIQQLRARTGRHAAGTIVYDETLPPSLARREPAAEKRRYGGTGSIGVSPRAVDPSVGHPEGTGPSSE